MVTTRIRNEEKVGLALAVLAHIALVAMLVLSPPTAPLLAPPERITVTLTDDAGLTSTSPEPAAQAAPDVAPVIGEQPAASTLPTPEPLPEPLAKPRPVPRALASPTPRPAVPKVTQKAIPARPAAPAGASRFADAFKQGVPGAQASGASGNPPAASVGPEVRSALAGAISRQLKPKWAAPQGVDAERLVTILSWSLNPDGTLAGRPVIVRQEGINDANRPQAARHAEQAIRAVQLAAPFNLPPEYYDAWKRVASFRFDKRLSQ